MDHLLYEINELTSRGLSVHFKQGFDKDHTEVAVKLFFDKQVWQKTSTYNKSQLEEYEDSVGSCAFFVSQEIREAGNEVSIMPRVAEMEGHSRTKNITEELLESLKELMGELGVDPNSEPEGYSRIMQKALNLIKRIEG